MFEATKIILDKNRIISILSLYQWQTYRDLLAGLPTESINESVIKGVIDKAKEICEIKEVFLIEPTQTPIEINIKLSYGDPIMLPKTACIAEILYCEINDERIEDISLLDLLSSTIRSNKYVELSLVWFQEEFCMPIDEKVIKQMEEIEWKKYDYLK